MPYKSQAQRRWMFWAEKHGKVKKGTAKKWEVETKNKRLPKKVKNKKNARSRIIKKRLKK